jgi:hypothetical protein
MSTDSFIFRIMRRLQETPSTSSKAPTAYGGFSRQNNEIVASVFLAILVVGLFRPIAEAEPARAPSELKQATIDAFDRYVQLTDIRNNTEIKQGTHLLWVDGLSEDARSEAYAALKRGEVKITKLDTRDKGAAIHCPDGLIHHWAGVAFIPGAKLHDVLAVMQDYENQFKYYAPDVERSKLESSEGGHFRAFLRFRRHKVITVVLDTEHDIHYFHDSDTRAHSRSSAVRIAQVENPGKSDEREKPPGDDDGFLWRMETWWRIL